MKKITTLFKKDPTDLSKVINEVDPNNEWVYTSGIPTRKYDGTACAIIEGKLYKRYDAKHGKAAPEGAIPCQDADLLTGHHPHWILTTEHDKYHNKAFEELENKEDGTYELIGEKIQNNPEKITGHRLIPHGKEILPIIIFNFESIKKYLEQEDIEGIVFHDSENTGKMCKIRKKDFGIKRT